MNFTIMKRLFATISLIFALAATAMAQENISSRCEIARMRTMPHSSAANAEQMGGEAIASAYIRPITEWQQSEDEEYVIFSSTFVEPFTWINRQVFLYVESATGAYDVMINGKEVGYTANNFTPTEFNITRHSQEQTNDIVIRIAKEHWSYRLNGFASDANASLGEVFVFSQPTIRVRDIVHNTSLDVTGEMANVTVGMIVKTESLNAKKARIHYELVAMADTTRVTYGHRDITLQMRGEDTIKFMARIPRAALWSAENPTRYRVNIMTQIEGRKAEFQSHPIGLRMVEQRDGKLFVNGEPISLSVAVCDPSKDFATEIVAARQRGKNAVHFTSPVVPQKAFRLCDSLGMYVVATVPINTSKSGTSRRIGGNESNNPQWSTMFVERSEAMWRSTCGFASIVAYALAEDSANGIALYESYLRLKELEQNRPIIYRDAAGEWNSDAIF